MPFSAKCFLLLFLGVLIPLAAQSAVFRWQTEESINRELMEKLNEELESQANELTAMLTELTTVANEYRQNDVLYRYLDQDYQKDLDVMVRYQDELYNLFTGNILFPREIRTIRVYTSNDSLFDTAFARTEASLHDGTLGQSLLYNNLQPIKNENAMQVQTAVTEENSTLYSDDRRLSLLVTLDFFRQYAQYEKLLRIDLDLDYVSSVLRKGSLFSNIYLADSRDSVIAAARGSGYGPFQTFSAQEQADLGLQVMAKDLGAFPLTLYGVSDPEIFAEQFNQSRYLSAAISAICLLICCLFIFTLTRSINKRLGCLVRQAGEIARGNFVTTKTREGGRDEFDVLQNSINAMSVQLRQLIEDGYQAEIARIEQEKETNRAKLLSLQAQVNPHFMFNALESVRLRALAKGEKETAGVIKYMARMLRNLIEWERNIITLREELRFLDEFLYIQNYRFEDEFSYDIDVSEEAYDCLLPKMILQPLVENACVHGVEAVSENRWVGIRARVNDGLREIRVEDNGGGMTPEKLQELQSMLRGDAKAGRSVGVWNVYRRLALYYGDNFQFDIESTPGQGTTCIVSLPVNKEEVLPCIPS